MAVGMTGHGKYLLGTAGGLIVFLLIIMDKRLREIDKDA
jgi:hypothetical protein